MAIDGRMSFSPSESDSLIASAPSRHHHKGLIPHHDPHHGEDKSSTEGRSEDGGAGEHTDRCKLLWVVVVLVAFHTLYFGLMRMSALPKLVQRLVEVEHASSAAAMGLGSDTLNTQKAGEISADLWGRMARCVSCCQGERCLVYIGSWRSSMVKKKGTPGVRGCGCGWVGGRIRRLLALVSTPHLTVLFPARLAHICTSQVGKISCTVSSTAYLHAQNQCTLTVTPTHTHYHTAYNRCAGSSRNPCGVFCRTHTGASGH